MRIEHSEITIIGGGVVGLSVALGLLQAGQQVHVLDGADGDARASQGNFGLVWLQGKGCDFAPYANWTCDALAAWPTFSETLADISGIDISLNQCGGFEFFTDADKFEEFAAMLGRQKKQSGQEVRLRNTKST